MAKKKKITPRSTIKKNKNEFLLGIIVFIALIFTIFKVLSIPQRSSKSQKAKSPTPTSPQTKRQKQNQKLIGDNGFKTVTIIENDSYWKIAERACGNAKLYWLLEAQNNGRSLFAGESVVANCQP